MLPPCSAVAYWRFITLNNEEKGEPEE